jgi:aldehyde:ferredoxin oxidoreductase
MPIGRISGGLAGKILRVNLSDRRITYENTENYARHYLGGRAIGSWILINESNRLTRWDDVDNLLIFSAGALNGTIVPGANRVSIETINVFNNGKGSANVGGFFGPELKFAGFDCIVIIGKAEKPVYLWIHNGNVELRDAEKIWGHTTFGTEKILEQIHSPLNIRVASIGPSGENLVKGSGVVCDRSKVAGGSGVGCVMGDKKLKAIVVCGDQGAIHVAHKESFFSAVDRALKKIQESPTATSMREQSYAGRWSDPNCPSWDLFVSARNGQDDFWEMSKRVELGGFSRFRTKITACMTCPVGCMPFSVIPDGKYGGCRGEGFWGNTLTDAVRLDLTDPAGVIQAWVLSNELGLDTDFAAGVCSWAFECYEKGILTTEDTGGLKLDWGNVDVFIELLHRIAYRRGIGELLACGCQEASSILGGGSDQFAIHMKGQDTIDPYRISKGWALGVATSPVAGRHLRGAITGGKRFGPKGVDFPSDTYPEQPQYVIWQSLTKEMEDMLGICVYVGTWAGAYALEPEDYVNLTNAVMGTNLTEDELFYLARRSYNLEKAFNTLHTDFGRKDDYPPARYMEEPVKKGKFAGHRCDRTKFDAMLSEFYRRQGWDPATGLQTRRQLTGLGLSEIAKRLEEAGKLIDETQG